LIRQADDGPAVRRLSSSRAADALESVLLEGVEAAMNKFN
jgi:hypothetical protein